MPRTVRTGASLSVIPRRLADPGERSVERTIDQDGYAFVPAATMRPALEAAGPLSDWTAFAASWNTLARDTYLAEQGLHRRRRYAAYTVDAAGIRREPHQPHVQSIDYNPLFGDVARWFEPVTEDIGSSATLLTILRFCQGLFGGLAHFPQTAADAGNAEPNAWGVEVHQFRIEAKVDEQGNPTPEGSHRDGVDFAFVLLVHRENLVQGVTTIHDLSRRQLGSFTLTDPCDAAIVDDNRVYHGVTPVTPLDPARPAYRDALVVTFRHMER
jgi:hypothetical protein